MPQPAGQTPSPGAVQAPQTPAAPEPAAERTDLGVAPTAASAGRLFRFVDWTAAGVAFLATLVLYMLTLAPNVTLEDSGELVVAADYLGVPHPPGYPVWTVIAWLCQWLFHWVRYKGFPNPAYGVNFASALFGALSCALVALLTSRSSKDLLRALKGRDASDLPPMLEGFVTWLAGVSAALLLGFSQIMWSQSVIAEVYALNTFLHVLILLLAYMWMRNPASDKLLYVTAFFFGLTITNCQPVVLIMPALLAAFWLGNRNLFRDSMSFIGVAGFGWLCVKIKATLNASRPAPSPEMPRPDLLSYWNLLGNLPWRNLWELIVWTVLVLCVAAWAVKLIANTRRVRSDGGRLALVALLFAAGMVVAAFTAVAVTDALATLRTPPKEAFEPWTAEGWANFVYMKSAFFSLIGLALIAGAIAGIIFTGGEVLTEWRRILFIAVFIGLGLCAFIYMPIASDQNPPMNWGYTRTWEGFKHAVTRGQYQKLDPAILPLEFFRQAGMFFTDLEARIPLMILLMAVVPFFFLHRIDRVHRIWLAVIAIAYIFLSVIFMAILNPGHDIQAMFIARVQFVQGDAVLCIWLGYSLALAMLGARELFRHPAYIAPVAALALVMPASLIWKNYNDKELVRMYGGCEQNGHDFGWQFGYYQLVGARGIMEDIKPGEPPLPNPEYPPEMTTNAIFFGGTDPGRFVPTYMIYSALCRADVYLITQNALADNTYMNVMRDLYGDRIWMPAAQDSNIAFQKYVKDVQEGRIPANAAIQISPEGKVSVQGVQGVMEINGIICKMIFDMNKHKHDFYVEESYVINWMYPYLEPHGLIMKINKEPLPALSEEVVRNDREFWDWYAQRLMANPKFLRDMVARKTFSKLRCAIAGVYTFRRMINEAEYGFRQAVELYPLSPEANFRLADLYIQTGRFDDAIEVMQRFAEQDRRNDRVRDFVKQIVAMKKLQEQIVDLQTTLQQGRGTVEDAVKLAELFIQANRINLFQELAVQILNNTNVPPEVYIRVAELYGKISPPQPSAIAEALRRYLQRRPTDAKTWVELGCLQVSMNDHQGAMNSLRQAIGVGGEPVRAMLRADPRVNPLRNMKEFGALVAPRQSFPGGFQF